MNFANAMDSRTENRCTKCGVIEYGTDHPGVCTRCFERKQAYDEGLAVGVIAGERNGFQKGLDEAGLLLRAEARLLHVRSKRVKKTGAVKALWRADELIKARLFQFQKEGFKA